MTATTVHVAVYDTLADWEVGLATAHIANGEWQRHPGSHQVRTVGAGAPVTSMGGMHITPDVVLADLQPADSAMLILPGAATWDDGTNDAFARTARTFLDAGVPVAAICGATWGLATEGLLDDRAHTSNAAAYLAASGYGGAEHYRDELVVVDGDLITANSTAPVEFARAVLERLALYEPAVLASWYKLFAHHDPAGYYELEASAT
jgi:putative intracellular protease/amidase